MNEISESDDVKGDLAYSGTPQQSYAAIAADTLHTKALEWFEWDVALEIVFDGNSLDVVYPADQSSQERRRLQASVLKSFLCRCFDPKQFATFA